MENLKLDFKGQESIEPTLEKLAEHGVLILENYLSSDDLSSLIKEYEEILQTENQFISVLDYPQGVARIIEFDDMEENAFPKTQETFSSDFMRQVANRYLGTPNYFNHHIYVAKDEYEEVNALNQLHYDKISTLKFFLYLNDIDETNGAFEAVPGSHKLAKNIMDFYQKRGKKIAKLPNRNLPESMNKPVPMVAKAGSMIVFTSDTFHRAGRVDQGKNRMIMRGHCRPKPMTKYAPDLFSKQWFNESILNPSRYVYGISDLISGKTSPEENLKG
jgi:hypothetical protein